MKKLLITLLFTAFAVSAYCQLPAGSISNKRGFFFELKGRDTIGVYTGRIKVDTLQLVSGQKLFRLTDTAAIYTLLNSKIDSVSISNDTLYFHRDNTGPLAVKVTGISDTATLQMVLTKGNTATTGMALGTSSLDSKALFEVSSTTKGVLIPRMTITQMLAVSSPTEGLQVMVIPNCTIWIYNGTNWIEN